MTKRRKPAPKTPITWLRAALDSELEMRRQLLKTLELTQKMLASLGRGR